MTIKAILLIADRDETAPGALQWARPLAKRLDAHLQIAWIGDTAKPAVSAEDFATRSVSIERDTTADPKRIVHLAQHADMTVIRLPEPGTAAYDDEMLLIEQIALEVGCPMVVLPWNLAPERVAQRIAVAWNASASAQRALRACLPLLTNGAVAIVSVHPDAPLDLAAPVGRFLERHKVAAVLEPIIGKDKDAGALIAQAVEQLDIDLLVMGAWSRQPIVERLLGGATRYLLGRLGIPILLSA
ncbi:MAG: universal stress protein [Alphaproteobacteria bacterium]|nr:universal stress protein [Alphaproteobacteria bacterium]